MAIRNSKGSSTGLPPTFRFLTVLSVNRKTRHGPIRSTSIHVCMNFSRSRVSHAICWICRVLFRARSSSLVMSFGSHGGEDWRPRTRARRMPSLVVRAQHFEKAKLDGLREIVCLLGEPILLIVERDVAVEVGPFRPVLVEIEHVRIVEADMEVVVDAALLGP